MPTEKLILAQLHCLPEHLKLEVLHYIAFLQKEVAQKDQPAEIRKRRFGSAENKYKLTADFDAPLDDFKEYM
ncbi:type II toxin-antitoxin system VapB family antitoxin [Arsenicibacter rosenii]|uniref:DUF2281 domain-containing protein n=1 Tax=Arsenicibacter rosenii TaxID=1750698 RepID=A0A1S2VMT8_9BACT|nr:DUF2281 domain-containing protein [Arsenicibacter rosenii]OIN60074.1 hypothetical protein BLX24_04285 [Arsenicibacter rosenii]